MTTVFRSCLPRIYSNTNQSISSDNLSNKTNSNVSLNNDEHDQNSIDCSSTIINKNILKSKIKHTTNSLDLPPTKTELINNECNHTDLLTVPKQTKVSGIKSSITNKRGPCYSRINEEQKPLLKRLVGTIFGDHGFSNNQHNEILSTKKQRSKRPTVNSKKSLLPSKSILKKQYDDNEKTLRSLVTFLTQIESNIPLPTIHTSVTDITTDENQNKNLPMDKEHARNNNRMDDTYVKKLVSAAPLGLKCGTHMIFRLIYLYITRGTKFAAKIDRCSSHSNDSYQHKSKGKHNHQHSSTSKRCANTRSTRKNYSNKKPPSDDDTLSCSSMTSHNTLPSSPNIRRKMIDNQQQTQIYPIKTNIGTSTQINHTNDVTTSEPSWLDVMREDQTTINAWARIRRRLKPNQQKDILR
ncbi:unnamed protein product [Rotaria socialis]|nr:unnamed protein product [Rotaria socialis]CAF3449254.1 unnamed protein product [Rotaria socialis]